MNAIERYSRQRDLVPAERLAACDATVIGVGAVGRQVALQLTAMGVPRLQLVDFDSVEESNIASQGYREADLGRPKVEATASACRQIRADLPVAPICDRFKRSSEIGDAVFCCVTPSRRAG
ncbi:MAG: HesA/MoeB/ThiF family protein [Planctomycetota bacterium]